MIGRQYNSIEAGETLRCQRFTGKIEVVLTHLRKHRHMRITISHYTTFGLDQLHDLHGRRLSHIIYVLLVCNTKH
ncbi:hypothetical protein D3C84_1055370 [compost metagenome]